MANGENMRWIVLTIAVLLLINTQSFLPKETIAGVEGQACTLDTDCPCAGAIEGTDAVGIGVSTCTEGGTCDTSLCVDIKPVSQWLKDNPLNWAKENPLYAILIAGLFIMVIFWPKR